MTAGGIAAAIASSSSSGSIGLLTAPFIPAWT
jgi:hypothetical protein